jgi:hypothetical protein
MAFNPRQMKIIPLILLIALALTPPVAAQTNSAPLPKLADVIQRAMERAVAEDENDRQFKLHYDYTRTRVTEYRNSRGELKKKEEKRDQQSSAPPTATNSTMKAAPKPQTQSTNEPLSESHSNVRGKALRVKDYSLPELVARFDFTLVGREMTNGHSLLVLDFKPADRKLPINNFKDKFINKAAGRFWVDEQDYAITRAEMHLTKKVSVFGGIAGSVSQFTYSFERERMPEGFWYSRNVDWHLEGREVIFNRIVDYHERKFDVRKVRLAAR